MTIGLTHTGNPQKHQYYIEWLKSNEDIQMITISVTDNNLNEINNCDGLVLSGGLDIYPPIYKNETLDYPNAPKKGFQQERDEFEIAAFKLAQKNNIPVLGICRGMQLINIIHKGTLIQDLGDESLNKVHKGNPDKYHPISVEQKTLLHEITGLTKGEINSAHHQAINVTGEGLLVNCKAEDGTIEGIEWIDKADKPFMLAIQWHPERMFRLQDSPLSKGIRNQFILAIKKIKYPKNEDH